MPLQLEPTPPMETRLKPRSLPRLWFSPTMEQNQMVYSDIDNDSSIHRLIVVGWLVGWLIGWVLVLMYMCGCLSIFVTSNPCTPPNVCVFLCIGAYICVQMFGTTKARRRPLLQD